MKSYLFYFYSSELDNILKEKRGVFPEFVLDEQSDGMSRATLMENAGIDCEPSGSGITQQKWNQIYVTFTYLSTGNNSSSNSPSSSDCTPTKRTRISATSLQEQILRQITELRKDRSEYYKEKVALLKEKKELDERKLRILEKIERKLDE